MKAIYTNGTFYTMNPSKATVQSIVVDNERILDMGAHEDMILQWGRTGTPIINMEEKTIIPGLIDSHLHISSVGINSLELNLIGIKSKDELLAAIKKKASTLLPGEWILGRGWDENIFPDKQIPSIQELDYVAPYFPLFLPRICGHAFLVNSRALSLCGYHTDMFVPYGGTIVTDPSSRKPTGLLLETASTLITKHIPQKSFSQLKDALKNALQDAVSLGLTSIHTNDPNYLGGAIQTYKLFNELVNKEGIGPRSNLLMDYDYLEELKASNMFTGYGNNKVMIGAIKLFADGALGGRTALLSQPYEDDGNNFGNAMYDNDELFQIIKDIRENNMPVAIHAIGDLALKNVLDSLDLFEPTRFRDRLIHVSILNEVLMERLKGSHRISDVQPKFVTSDYPWIIDRLGENRAKFAYPFKTLLQNGVLCAGGSDAPIEPLNPLLGIHAAVTRKKREETHDGYNVQEKLSMYEAIQLFTLGGAYATNEEYEKGTLERGKLCDMTVLSQDPFRMKSADELLTTKVEMTVIGGEIKYRNNELIN